MSHIAKLLESRGMSQTHLSKLMGVSRQAVSGWCLNGKLPRTPESIARLAEILCTTPDDLITGEKTERTIATDTIEIPYFDVKASCGGGAFVEDSPQVQMLTVSKAWVRLHAPMASAGALNVIMADGDSMMPTIESGDILLVDTSKTEITSDAIYAFVYDGQLFVKRIQRAFTGLRIISDNPVYPPIDTIKDENFRVIGRVYCVGHFKAI